METVIENNEYRYNLTEGGAKYICIGDTVRSTLIDIVVELRKLPTPKHRWNHHDVDALDTMDTWLRTGQDFNDKQWFKFRKMYRKLDNMPANFDELAKECGWTKGQDMSKADAYQWMEHKREIQRDIKLKIAQAAQQEESIKNLKKVFMAEAALQASNNFDKFFTEVSDA